MDERLAECGQAGDPHLGRRERVHPGDHTDAVRRGIRLAQDGRNLVRGGDHGLGHDPHRDRFRFGEPGRDPRGVAGDLVQGGLAVEVLAPGHEPRLERGQDRLAAGGATRLWGRDRHFTAPWVRPDT
jgi:hypothetical protein